MVYLILHKFAKLAKLAKFAKFAIVLLANSSLASTTKRHSLANSSLASLKDFQKWPFWRVLEFDKFAGEWPLLSKNSTLNYYQVLPNNNSHPTSKESDLRCCHNSNNNNNRRDQLWLPTSLFTCRGCRIQGCRYNNSRWDLAVFWYHFKLDFTSNVSCLSSIVLTYILKAISVMLSFELTF